MPILLVQSERTQNQSFNHFHLSSPYVSRQRSFPGDTGVSPHVARVGAKHFLELRFH